LFSKCLRTFGTPCSYVVGEGGREKERKLHLLRLRLIEISDSEEEGKTEKEGSRWLLIRVARKI
jgi:hypothetical protein